jgi:protein-S-isoprenylcysteine O-methyltransferase Ste14
MIVSAVAWLLIMAGAVLQIVGLAALRWCAAAPSVNDSLVTASIYSHIRHPLYSGLMLELLGLFIYIPTVNMLIACGLGLLWIMIQARLEEMDLKKRLPEYATYMQQVPRFIPKLK